MLTRGVIIDNIDLVNKSWYDFSSLANLKLAQCKIKYLNVWLKLFYLTPAQLHISFVEQW